MAHADTTLADVWLFERIAKRDANALGELYDRCGRLLFNLIRRILNDEGEAEEVLQDVFLQVWSHAATYTVALGSPTGWLVGIARHRAIDRLRAKSVRSRAAAAVRTPSPIETPEMCASLSERRRSVRRALDGLPLEQRELIESAYFCGLTQTELATRFGLPLGTVKTRIRTGMRALRRHLQWTVVEY